MLRSLGPVLGLVAMVIFVFRDLRRRLGRRQRRPGSPEQLG